MHRCRSQFAKLLLVGGLAVGCGDGVTAPVDGQAIENTYALIAVENSPLPYRATLSVCAFGDMLYLARTAEVAYQSATLELTDAGVYRFESSSRKRCVDADGHADEWVATGRSLTGGYSVDGSVLTLAEIGRFNHEVTGAFEDDGAVLTITDPFDGFALRFERESGEPSSS